jgi:gluconolactonase
LLNKETSMRRPAKKFNARDISIVRYHVELDSIIGPSPSYAQLLNAWNSSRSPFFHASCIYIPQHEQLYTTSAPLPATSESQLPVILISKMDLQRGPGASSGDEGALVAFTWSKLRPPTNMPMPAGATPYRDGMLFCAQGGLDIAGGLFYMPHRQPPRPLVTHYFGRDFNSPRDVLVDPRGFLWFTDPMHGAEADFRPSPLIPCQVYCFSPATADLRVVADGLGRPHGLAISPGGDTLYVSDVDAARVNGDKDVMR